MGEACAHVFADDGYAVLALDVAPAGEDVAASIRSRGCAATFVRTDVSRHEEVGEAIRIGLQEFGRIDALVNCAGIDGTGGFVVDIDDDDLLVVAVHRPLVRIERVGDPRVARELDPDRVDPPPVGVEHRQRCPGPREHPDVDLARAQVVVTAHAHGLAPREALDDDLVGEYLQPDADEALEPLGVLALPARPGGPRVLPGEAHLYVVGLHPQRRTGIAGAQPGHVVRHQLLCQPRNHRHRLRAAAVAATSLLIDRSTTR